LAFGARGAAAVTRQIGTLGEMGLHAGIKAWYGRPGDQFEVPLDGYVIDIIRGDQLIEIQTGNFSALKQKFHILLQDYDLHLLYPLAAEKWILRQTATGEPVSRRKSPKKEGWLDAFHQLVRIPHLLQHPRLRLSLLRTQQEVVWVDDGRGSWRRRRWSIGDRRLLAVLEMRTFQQPAELLSLLPADLPTPFTNPDLTVRGVPARLAQRITYTLRGCGVLERVGKRGRAYLYAPVES
jgi:hypothetical protein